MNSMWKRSFALLLSLVMVFGMVPVNAFAEETEHSHSYEATVTDPTCTAVGYTTYTCACGDSYTADEVAATGHSYADGVCSVCGAAEHTHSYESVVTAPTCTEAGFTTYTCSCGDSYTADEVAALGHSYADGVCGTCGAVEVKVCSVDENCEADTHEAECPMGPCTVTVGCELVKGHVDMGIPCTGRDTYEEEIPEGAVAVLAGTEIYVTDLNQAFTEAVNPDKKSVLMIADCTQNVEITDGQYYSFYLNGYTLTGTFKLSSGVVNFYGAQGTGPSGTIQNTGLDGNYAIHCKNGNLNLGAVNVVATGTNGTAVYADGSKLNLDAEATIYGNVETSGYGVLNISKGTVNGSLIKGTGTALTVTGGTFSEDPSHCLPEGYEAVLKDGKYVVQVYEASLDELEQDTSGAYLISDADDVVLFRTLLNVSEGKNILSGVAFKQTKDIDMAGITLPPAGSDSKRFMGSFDGQGYKISNVTIEAAGESYVAFFGNTSGATIKNVTLHNISVNNPGGSYTAGLVGFTRNSTITQCAVTGEISISGGAHTGGIHAGGVVNITECDVDGTGTISGTTDVGAISALISEGSTTVENNSVKGITVKGSGLVGGLVGRAIVGSAGLSVANNTMTDTKVESTASSYPQNGLAVGATQAINGVATYKDNTFTNSTLTEAGVSSNVIYGIENFNGASNGTNVKTDIVAYVGDTPYATLLEALEAAIETGASTIEMVNSTREKMPNDVEIMLTNDLTITANSAVVADFYNEGTSFDFIVNSKTGNHTFTIDTNVTFQLPDRLIWLGYYGNNVDVVVKGTMSAKQIWHGADTLVTSTGTLSSTGEAFIMRRGATLSVEGGTVNANYFNILSGNISAKNATIDCGALWVDNTSTYAGEGSCTITLDNTKVTGSGNMKLATDKTAIVNVTNGSILSVTNFDGYGASVMDGNSVVNIDGGTLTVAGTLENNGAINVSGNSKLTINNLAVGTVTVEAGANLTDTTIAGAGTTKFANGEISFNGKNEIITTSISGYPFGLKVNEGATLLITRFVLGYGRDITVSGNIVDASTFVPGDATPSLKANSTSGFSIGGDGVNTLTAKDAYLDFDSSSWKTAKGKYDWTFENSYVKAVSFGKMLSPDSADAAWTVTFDDSVLAADNYIKPAEGVTYSFTNGSEAKTGSMRVDGVLNIDKTSSVTVTNQQNNKVGTVDEHGDILGTVNVEGVLSFEDGGSTSIDLLGGKLNVLPAGVVNLGDKTLRTYENSELTVAVGSDFIAPAIEGAGKIIIDATDYVPGMSVPVQADVSKFTGTVETINSKLVKAEIKDGRIVFIGAVAKIGDQGYYSLDDALAAAKDNDTVELLDDVNGGCTVNKSITLKGNGKKLTGNLLITADTVFEGELTVVGGKVKVTNGATLTIPADAVVTGEGDVFFGAGNDANYYGLDNAATAGGNIVVNGELSIYQMNANAGGKVTVAKDAKMTTAIICVENGGIDGATAGEMNINGEVETQLFKVFGGATANIGATGVVSAEQAFTSSGLLNVVDVFGNATLNVSGKLETAQTEHTEGRHSTMKLEAGSFLNINGGEVNHGGTLTNNGTVYITGASDIAAKVTGDGWVYVNGATMSNKTNLKGAKVGFINGTNNVVGSTIDNGYFSVGIGKNTSAEAAASFAKAKGITLGNVVVNVSSNAVIGGNGETYSGWVGSAYSADKTAHTYTLNIENSQAVFGYIHVSKDGVLNVKGHTTNKYTYDGTSVDFHAGELIVNGKVTLDGTDADAWYTKMSVDHADGILNIVNGAKFESNIRNGSSTDTTVKFWQAGKIYVDGAATTVKIDDQTLLVDKAEIKVTNGAKITANGVITGAGTLNVDMDSSFVAPELKNGCKVVIDTADYEYGDTSPVVAKVTDISAANLSTTTNVVKAVKNAENYIELVGAIAIVGDQGYYTLQEAATAANGKETVTLLADIPANPAEDAGLQITVPMNVDLNGHTLKADFNGTLTMNGGTYRNANGFRMVAPETANDASAYAYNSSDAVLTISATGIDITKGTMSIGLPGGMGTDPNHKLQLLNDATLTIPEGKPLVLRSEAKVASTATVNGTILLEGNGTIITAKELSVASATADRKVVYVDGAYKLVSSTAKAVIGNQGYDSLADAIKNAEPGETIKLVEDITENVQINDAVTVDLNGKTLTGKITSKNDSAKVKSNGVTIELGKEDAVTSDSTGVLTVAPNLDEVGYGSVKISKNGVTTTYFTSKDTKTGQLATVTVSANGVVKTHGKVIVGAQANGKPAYNYTITQSNVHSNNHVRNTSPDMVISCNGFLAACDRVYITGGQYGTGIHEVYKNGSAQNGFSVVDGSTQVTLSQAYLNSLHDGSYTMVFKYKDGEQVKAPFVVSTYYNANADTTNPKTGDEIALPMFVMFSTAAALAVLVMGKKKYF